MGFGITGLAQAALGASDRDLYGKKPIVPTAVDYSAALEKILRGNISAIPDITDLATKSTKLYSSLMETAIPGIEEVQKKALENVKAWESGKLSDAEVSQIKQYVGAQAFGAGFSPGMRASREAEVFGQSSYARQQQGVAAAQRWAQQAQSQTFDFSKMFLGPEAAMRQADMGWQRDWLENQVAAAPDPAVRGGYDTEMGFIGMVASMYSGGAGYQGYYKPSYGGGGAGGGAGGGSGGNGNSFFGGGGGEPSADYQINNMRPMTEWQSGTGGYYG